MDTLDNIRSSFLNKNGFKVGFSNRSPLNQYKSTVSTSFNLPKLDGAKVGKHMSDGAQAISNAKIKGAEDINQSIMGAADEISQAIDKKQKDKKDLETNEKLELQAGLEENREFEAKETRIENMPAFVENWQKENPAYNMDDFKAKYGEELNEWMKRNPGTPTGRIIK